MSQLRLLFLACVLLVPLLPHVAKAQDLAVVSATCDLSGRVMFSIRNLDRNPSGVFRIRVSDANGRQLSNFGPQGSIVRGQQLNASLELIDVPLQQLRVIVDPGNRLFDRNRANNVSDVLCGSGGPGGQDSSADCREIDVLGIPVTICEPGSAPPPTRLPRRVRFDLAIENARCGPRRVRFEVGNFGTGQSGPTQVALLNASTNAIVRTWEVPALVLGQVAELSGFRPVDGDYVLTILQRGDANPQNDTVNITCGRVGGPGPLPPSNLGGDIALVNPRCSQGLLLFDARNIGGTRTSRATAILIDESDTVVATFDIVGLQPGQVDSDRTRQFVRGMIYRIALIDANDANLGNNFIVFRC